VQGKPALPSTVRKSRQSAAVADKVVLLAVGLLSIDQKLKIESKSSVFRGILRKNPRILEK
jgi:hypothetical protein